MKLTKGKMNFSNQGGRKNIEDVMQMYHKTTTKHSKTKQSKEKNRIIILKAN